MDFEAKFYITNNMYKKYVNNVLCFNMRIICVVLLIISFMFIFICYDYDIFLFFVSIFCFLITGIIIIIYPLILYYNLINLDKKIHNGKKYEAIISFGDDIIVIEGKQKISIAYAQINKIFRIDNMLVLMFSKQNGIFVDLNCFIVGDKKNFYKYIIKRCNRVGKIIKR